MLAQSDWIATQISACWCVAVVPVCDCVYFVVFAIRCNVKNVVIETTDDVLIQCLVSGSGL